VRSTCRSSGSIEAVAADGGPEYSRPPIHLLLLGVVASIPIAVLFYELWPRPIPAVLIGLVSGVLPTFWSWRGSALPVSVFLDEDEVRARNRRLRAAWLSIVVLAVAAAVLWPFRR
jgi:hypothetical protein